MSLQELCPTDGELVNRIRDWIKDAFGSPASLSDRWFFIESNLTSLTCIRILWCKAAFVSNHWAEMVWLANKVMHWLCGFHYNYSLLMAKAAMWPVIDTKQLGNLDREGLTVAAGSVLSAWDFCTLAISFTRQRPHCTMFKFQLEWKEMCRFVAMSVISKGTAGIPEQAGFLHV